jgi:hypothetical protein
VALLPRLPTRSYDAIHLGADNAQLHSNQESDGAPPRTLPRASRKGIRRTKPRIAVEVGPNAKSVRDDGIQKIDSRATCASIGPWGGAGCGRRRSSKKPWKLSGRLLSRGIRLPPWALPPPPPPEPASCNASGMQAIRSRILEPREIYAHWKLVRPILFRSATRFARDRDCRRAFHICIPCALERVTRHVKRPDAEPRGPIIRGGLSALFITLVNL